MIRNPVADAWNAGENRYRQTVLGQGPLPGYPLVLCETMPTERAPVLAVDRSWSTPPASAVANATVLK